LIDSSELKALQTYYKLAKIHLKRSSDYLERITGSVNADKELIDYVDKCAKDDIHFLEIEDALIKSSNKKSVK